MRIDAVTAQTIRWAVAGRGAARGCTERASVVLEVRSDRGVIGLGEAAPLPGMSLDTLDDAERAIAAFARSAPFEVEHPPVRASQGSQFQDSRAGASSSDFGATDLRSRLLPFEIVDRDAAYSLATAPPAARFAIETALCDAIARARGVSLAALLTVDADPAPIEARAGAPAADHTAPARSVPDPTAIPLAAVIDDPEAAGRAYAAGIHCFKIKLRADDVLDRVFAIAAAAPEATLRIDANRSWPIADVAARLAALAELPIDYVEEPCRDAHQLLSTPLACKLALDESLQALSRHDLVVALRSPQLAAVILKPTLLGGLSAALELAALARRFGVAAVVSHALEGPIGTAACAELALALALAGDHLTSSTSPATGGASSLTRRATSLPVGLASHSALAGWRIEVAQLAADHIHAAATAGLGFADLDLAGVVRACHARILAEAPP